MFGTRAAFLMASCIAISSVFHVHLYAQIKILFPFPNQSFYPDRVVRIEWTNQESTPVDVLYSQDKGSSWTAVATGVQDNGFDWLLPLLDTQAVSFKVQIASLQQPEEFQRLLHRQGVRSSCFSPRSDFILSTLDNSLVELRSTDDRLSMASNALSAVPAGTSCFYPGHSDTSIVILGAELGLVANSTLENVIRFGVDPACPGITAIATHPSEPYVAAACADGLVRVYSLVTRSMVQTLGSTVRSTIHTVAFSPDGQRLLYAGDEGIIFIENWKDRTEHVIELRGHGDGGRNMAVLCAQFSPDGKSVISGGVDYTVRIWDLQYESIRYVLYAHGAAVTNLKFSLDGTRFLTASLDSTVRQWSMASARELHAPLRMTDVVSALDYSRGGDTLLVAERNSGTITLWKNIRQTGASDSVSGSITYPVSLRIGNTTSIVGSRADIPIVFDPLVRVPFFERSRFDARVRVTLPRHLVEVEAGVPGMIVTHGDERDTVSVPIVFSSNDTVGRIPVKFLLSEESSSRVDIINGPQAISWANSVRAFVLDHVTNGIVVADKQCPDQGRGGLSFTTISDATLYPQPADSRATLSFTAFEEGEYKFELMNEVGMTVATLDSRYCMRGSVRLDLNADLYHSAAYMLRIVAPSTIKVLPFIVTH